MLLQQTKYLIGLLTQSNENDNRHFWQIFFNYKFLCVKIVANTNKNIWWEHTDRKLKLKNNELCWSSGSLWLFKLCDKMWLTFCVASITVPTSFHESLGVKPCFETKFCQKFPYKTYFSVVWKVVAQGKTFCNLLWLTVNLGVISRLENIRSTEMYNH